MQRHIDTLTKTIHEYVERQSVNSGNLLWEIRKSPLGGFGLFATRPIEIGEIILKEYPLILGPRSTPACPLSCVNCYEKDNLKPCEKKCGLKVCSVVCQDSSKHQKECKIIRQWQTIPLLEVLSEKLYKVLTPIRFLFLSDEDKEMVKCLEAHRSDQHGFEVDIMKNILHLDVKQDEEMFMRFVCAVMDVNAFEVMVGNEENQSSVKGLYPLSSFANHSCTPNTSHVFDGGQRMILRASTFIPKGAEIFHCYSRIIWGTSTRRFYLYRTKQFFCKCQRCRDSTEFGSYISAIFCKICKKGKVIPIDPLIQNGKWQCEDCGETVNRKDVAAVTSLLGSVLNSFNSDDVDIVLRFIEKKLLSLVPEYNESVVALKYKLIWILGHQVGYTWSELSESLLLTKEKFCEELLALLEIIHLGQCRMRGLLLYELCCCYREMNRREAKCVKVSRVFERNLLLEAADILMYDAGAPPEIKKFWPDEIKLMES